MLYEILKALHIVAVIAWMAGLLYLPRLFVYHVDVRDEASHERFVVMERRLLGITHLGGALAVGFGVALLTWWLMHAPDYARQGWLHAKLTLVAGLIVYHLMCRHFLQVFIADANTRSHTWFRVFNEIPVLMLLAVVLLVIVKPF